VHSARILLHLAVFGKAHITFYPTAWVCFRLVGLP
jgi:hypothetical protein